MKSSKFRFLIAFVAVLIVAGCAQQPTQPAEPPDTRAADAATIQNLVKEWSAAAQAKDADKFASFYADNGVLMLGGAPPITSKAAIREATGEMMKDPNFALSFQSTGVEVARSGDLAYESGTFSMTMSNPKTKKPATEKGNYVVVWAKQAGTWKVVRDVPVVGAPEMPAAK